MHIRARVLGFSGALIAAIFLLTSLVVAQRPQQQQPPQGKKEPPKFDKAQQQEITAAVKTVDDAMGGQPGPADATIKWQYHFLKARDKQTYVPFVLTFDDKLNGSLVYYLRVVNKNAPPPPPPPKKEPPRRDPETGELLEQPKEEKPAPRPEYPFEDIRFIEAKPSADGQPHRLTVAMSVPPGEYDVYALLRQRAPKDAKKNAPPPPGALLKQSVTVPNFWTDELMTSTVILSSKVEDLPNPAAETGANPYIFGNAKVTPSADNKFAKTDELSILFQIYNTGLTATGKPDVTIDYNFYQKAGGAEKFFNRTNPQALNAETLPPHFDPAAGHTLPGGLSIPLASFPEGEYRLEIKVTDKAGNKTKVENITLTVGA
jgi:hypothetical protein